MRLEFSSGKREFFKNLFGLGVGAFVFTNPVLSTILNRFSDTKFENINDPLENLNKLIEKINTEVQKINFENRSEDPNALLEPFISKKKYSLSDFIIDGVNYKREIIFLIEGDKLVFQTDHFNQEEKKSFFVVFWVKSDEVGHFLRLEKIRFGDEKEYTEFKNDGNLDMKSALENSPEEFYFFRENLEDILNLLQTINK